MRAKHIAGAVLVVFGAASAFAVPAQAEPTLTQEQLDEVFTQQLQDQGLKIPVSKAMTVAHGTCDVLNRGGSIRDAYLYIQKNTNLKSTKDIGTLGGLAVQAYCPNSLPKS